MFLDNMLNDCIKYMLLRSDRHKMSRIWYTVLMYITKYTASPRSHLVNFTVMWLLEMWSRHNVRNLLANRCVIFWILNLLFGKYYKRLSYLYFGICSHPVKYDKYLEISNTSEVKIKGDHHKHDRYKKDKIYRSWAFPQDNIFWKIMFLSFYLTKL